VYSKNDSTLIKSARRADDTSREIIRAIRQHFSKFIKELDNGLLEKAQLGLGHSYSRAKVHPSA
jgi:nucleolar protein 56